MSTCRRHPPASLGGLAGALVLLAAALPAGSAAQERVIRTFAQEDGLTAGPVWALAQDSTGFLWIGAQGGLFRFDGVEIRRWAPETAEGPVSALAVSPEGEVVLVGEGGRLLAVTEEGARSLPSPGAPLLSTTHAIAFDEAGTLWAIAGGRVLYREDGGGWRGLPPGALGGEGPRMVKARPGGGVLVGTSGGVWATETAGARPTLRRRVAAPVVADLISPTPDTFHVLTNPVGGPGSRVLEVTDAGTRELLAPTRIPPNRAISIVERGRTLWIATDRYLVALRPGLPPEALGLEDGIESGGPLLVDREGSLWLGSFVGLHQLPEPDTRLWSERQGLPSRHVRFLTRTGDALWVMTWAGPAYLYRSEGAWEARAVSWDSRSHLCADRHGGAWTASENAVVAIRDTVATPWPAPSRTGIFGCTPGASGGLWIGTRDELWYLDPPARNIRTVPLPPETPTGDGLVAALHDSRDRLWLVSRDRICHAPGRRMLEGPRAVEDPAALWSCSRVPGLGRVVRMVELEGGTLWAASDRLGLLAFQEDRWEVLPMGDLPTRTLFALVPSPRGGVWMVGHGILQRVREDGDRGWEVLERLTPWHGLPAASGGHLVEEEDGTIWIGSARGVFQLPPHVRFRSPEPPRVALVDAWVDGRSVPLDGTLELPYRRNRLELRFAAFTFRDPSLLTHEVRLAPGGTWTRWRGEPTFRWVDLGPGRYRVEYRASLGGAEWATLAEPFAFQVRPPWYRTPWFLGLSTLLLGGLGWAGYRARVAYLVGLESQRTRIAMDLHDEVGSGLASVGILSGILATDGLDAAERREAAREIARAAEELGHSLSDIVWSLDAGVTGLGELAGRLAEHGERLCADGGIRLASRFPEAWPAEVPELGVRRNVLLVGLEALHNAVRHADARRVELSLLPRSGGEWELAVRDDGAGIAASDSDPGEGDAGRGPDRGRGLPAMRARAAEIGGTLTVRGRAGGGTEVSLRFRLQRRWRARSGAPATALRQACSRAGRIIMRVRRRRKERRLEG